MHKVILSLAILTTSALHLHGVGSRIAYVDAFATARGNAYTATADSASAVFYNIAGLTQLEGTQVEANIYAFSAEHTYKGPIGSAKTDTSYTPVPNFFAAHKFKDQPYAVGFGLYAPFALGADWGKDAPFAPLGYKSDLQYAKAHFAFAWQVTDTLSIGFGPSYDMAEIELNTTGPLGSIEGEDETIGFSFSLLWQPNEHHSFGFNYQHGTDAEFDGKQKNFLIPSVGALTGDASAKLEFPESITFGYSYRPNEKWNIEYNIEWTNWDKVNDLTISNDFYTQDVALNWESGFLMDIGATRYFENGWNVSAGYTFVENAVPDGEFTPLAPDADRSFLNFGVGRKYDNISWQFVYQFSFDTKRKLTSSPSDPSFPINGEYDIASQSIAFSLSYSF